MAPSGTKGKELLAVYAKEVEEDQEDSYSRSRASSFEGFFASKGAAFALPDGDFARQASTSYGGELQLHLQSLVNLLRDEDVLRLVVKLESKWPDRIRYVAIASAFGCNDEEESVVIGIDWDTTEQIASVGLVVPLYRDTAIRMDGDGGFKLKSGEKNHILKAVSVQTMWTALQWIHKCQANASKYNFYRGGPSHAWVSYYNDKMTTDEESLAEWNKMDDLWHNRTEPIIGLREKELIMKLIHHKLKEVMMRVDLEEVTCRQLREMVEEETQIDLKEWKSYFDEIMLTILGQMDSSSQIFDFLYLGSEWNASNLEELKENGVGYILNITQEIDNFFPGTFVYHNIRVYDEEETDLLPYWGKTFRFIKKAQEAGSKCLVHCKMGISRSASSVIAFAMKEYGWSLNDAMKYVKSKRSCIQPNPSFWKQLITYEGILNSSRQRYNDLFTRARTKSDSAEIREKARKRKEARKNKAKHHSLDQRMPLSDETRALRPPDVGDDTNAGQAPACEDEVDTSSESDEEFPMEADGSDDDSQNGDHLPENEAFGEDVVQSLHSKDACSAPELTRGNQDTCAGSEESATPEDGQSLGKQTSVHRVKSVTTLRESGSPVQRSNSLQERGRKRLSDTNLWQGIKSSSAEHVNELGGKASLWDAIEKSEEEFSAREQDKRQVRAESVECGDPTREVESRSQRQTAEETNTQAKVTGHEEEAEVPDVEMEQKQTDAAEQPSEASFKRRRPYVGVPKEVIEVAESRLVKRHSRNFEESQAGVKVSSDNDVVSSQLREESLDEVASVAAAESGNKGRLDEADVEELPLKEVQLESGQARSEGDVEVERGLVRKETQGFEQQNVARLNHRRPGSFVGGGVEDMRVDQEEGGEPCEVQRGNAEPNAGLREPSIRSETSEQTFAEVPGGELMQEGEAVPSGGEISGRGEGEDETRKKLAEPSPIQRGGDDLDTRPESKEASDEIPKPGLVKRNTLLLEERAREVFSLDAGRSAKAPVDDRPTQTEGDPTRTELVSDAARTPPVASCGPEAGTGEDGRELQRGENPEDAAEGTWLEQNAGLVGRHKRMIEERLLTVDVAGKAQNVGTSENEGDPVVVEEAMKQSTPEGGGDVSASLLKRGDQVRDLDANPSSDADEVSIYEGSPNKQALESGERGDGGCAESGQIDLAVDTSSVVNVKTHTQLLEERLRGGDTQTPANVKRQDSGETERQGNVHEPATTLSPERSSQKPKSETRAVDVMSDSFPETDDSVGNVRRKTQLLERLIQDVAKAAEVFAQAKHGSASRRPGLRRNESLKVERVVDRSRLSNRSRSFSDVCRK